MSKKNKKIIFIIGLVLFVVVLIQVSIAGYRFVPFFFQLIFNRNIELKQKDSQINILLLGIGGGKHDGPNLTDTIIFASINTKNNKITLASIPRDLWFPDIKQRINAAYQIGLSSKKPGGGLILAEAAVEKITGQDIDYGIRIDFSGFVKAVDLLGGLDINVDNTLDDDMYPISGKEDDLCENKEEDIKAYSESGTVSAEMDLIKFPCRFKNLHFDKGEQRMDGETALEFVRSRHASGEEGSDFARSKRQEKVISALKDKIFSLQIVTDPAKLFSLYNIIRQSIDTDIKENELDDFVKLFEKVRNAKIKNVAIDTGDESNKRDGLLVNPEIDSEYDYQWILIPRLGNGNFSEIQKYVDCTIKQENCSISKITKE
jgi:polyisoprenyl-teichoic acid--peptidoglycan teichoic acid transferase